MTNATVQQTIAASSLASSSTPGNSNFAYSIWFYIDDWNYNYGKPKVLFGRVGSPSSSPSSTGTYGIDPCPIVTFGEIENNLKVLMTVFPSATSTSSTTHTCNISNIPIQAWCNLLISVYGRTLDIYLDGKLVNTFVLTGNAKINENTDEEDTDE
jgi:hypothetical protein